MWDSRLRRASRPSMLATCSRRPAPSWSDRRGPWWLRVTFEVAVTNTLSTTPAVGSGSPPDRGSRISPWCTPPQHLHTRPQALLATKPAVVCLRQRFAIVGHVVGDLALTVVLVGEPRAELCLDLGVSQKTVNSAAITQRDQDRDSVGDDRCAPGWPSTGARRQEQACKHLSGLARRECACTFGAWDLAIRSIVQISNRAAQSLRRVVTPWDPWSEEEPSNGLPEA